MQDTEEIHRTDDVPSLPSDDEDSDTSNSYVISLPAPEYTSHAPQRRKPKEISREKTYRNPFPKDYRITAIVCGYDIYNLTEKDELPQPKDVYLKDLPSLTERRELEFSAKILSENWRCKHIKEEKTCAEGCYLLECAVKCVLPKGAVRRNWCGGVVAEIMHFSLREREEVLYLLSNGSEHAA